MTLPQKLALAILSSLIGLAPVAAQTSDDRQQIEQLRNSVVEMIEALTQSGVLSRAKADEILKRGAAPSAAPSAAPAPAVVNAPAIAPAIVAPTAETPANTANATPANTAPAGAVVTPGTREPVRVQFVPETVKKEIREQIKQEVLTQAKTERWGDPGTLPDWLNRIRFEGDLRLRAQHDGFGKDNAPAAVLYDDTFVAGTNYADTTNTNVARNRLRLRARLGMTAQLNDSWLANMRISTGNTIGPVSTSSTSGDPSDRYGLKLDRAYLRWEPDNRSTITGGRMPNPYLSSELMFATDLGFDGLSATVLPRISNQWRGIATLGAFSLRENAVAPDRWLGALQIGAEWSPNSAVNARFAFSRYSYKNVEGVSDRGNFGTPSYTQTEYERGFRQKGNSLFRINDPVNDTSSRTVWGLVSKFDVQALTGSFDFNWFDPIRINVLSEFIRNSGYNAADIAGRLGGQQITRGTSGRLLRTTVGHPVILKRGDWQAFASYRYLEKDATLDAFTDPDFGFGGTNLKGVTAGYTYGFDRNVAGTLRFLSAQRIEGPRYSVDTVHFDINVRY